MTWKDLAMPSQKQIDYAELICRSGGPELPEQMSKGAYEAYISRNKSHMRSFWDVEYDLYTFTGYSEFDLLFGGGI